MNFIECTEKGYYGSNCTIPCPDVNCQECHIESGTCHVCKYGYKGHRCDTGTVFIYISLKISGHNNSLYKYS